MFPESLMLMAKWKQASPKDVPKIFKNCKFVRQCIKQTSRFKTKDWVNKMMNQEECILQVVILSLKLQC